MKIDSSTLVFFDASCLVAAAGRPSGGAGYVLSLCRRNQLRATSSETALFEAERAISLKPGATALAHYRKALFEAQVELVMVTPEAELEAARAIVEAKDDHVLAAALNCKAPFLLTHDHDLERAVNNARLPVRAITPGQFILGVLPAHEDFAFLRD